MLASCQWQDLLSEVRRKLVSRAGSCNDVHEVVSWVLVHGTPACANPFMFAHHCCFEEQSEHLHGAVLRASRVDSVRRTTERSELGAGRARISMSREMLHSIAPGTKVDDAAARQQKQIVKAVRNVAAGLMDGAHDLSSRHARELMPTLKWMH